MITNMHALIEDLFQSAPLRSCAAGQTLFRSGDLPVVLHMVTLGRIVLHRTLEDGTDLVLHRAVATDMVAEASVYAQVYHWDARAIIPSTKRSLEMQALHVTRRTRPDLAEAWAADFARKVQQARFCIEVRSLRTVRARIDAWLSEGNAWPPDGPIQGIAAEIGVTSEAPYRELGRRRQDLNVAGDKTGPGPSAVAVA